jgi:hypothetical protein
MANKVVATLIKEGVRKMGADERKRVVMELQEIEDTLSGRPNGEENYSKPQSLQNKPALIAKKKKLEEMLNKDDDLTAKDGNERDRINARVKELEEIIKKERLTRREEALKPGSGDFEAAVQKQIWNEKNMGKLILEWQTLKRRLEPENPLADNVALLSK